MYTPGTKCRITWAEHTQHIGKIVICGNKTKVHNHKRPCVLKSCGRFGLQTQFVYLTDFVEQNGKTSGYYPIDWMQPIDKEKEWEKEDMVGRRETCSIEKA